MSKKIDNLSFHKETENTNVHSLPCKLHFNGNAKIGDYFKPVCKEKLDESGVSFRGYPLNGKVMDIPESYHGFVFMEKSSENIVVEKKFKSVTYWDWDKTPSKNDPFVSAFDWLHFSSKIHDVVEDPC